MTTHITSITGTLTDNTGTEVEFTLKAAEDGGAFFNIKTISETVKGRGYDWVAAVAEALDHEGYFGDEEY